MNIYWAGFCALLFMLWTAGATYVGHQWGGSVCEAKVAQHDEAQAGRTVAATRKALADVGNQQNLTTEVDNAHRTGITAIDSLYDSVHGPGVPAAGHGADAVPGAAGGPHGAACEPPRSRYYRLSPKECDSNTRQLLDLQAWVRGQSALASAPR